MKSAHDPLRSEQHRESAGRTSRLRVHRRNAVQSRINFRNECAEMKLLGELAGVEISHRGGLDFRRIDLRVGDRLAARFRDQVANRFAFLLEVALKVSSACAENVNRFHDFIRVESSQRALRPLPKHCPKSSKFQIPSSKKAPTSKPQKCFCRMG